MKDKESRLCLGMTFAFYGILLLLDKLGVLIHLSVRLRMELLDWRTFILYGAAFFLLFKKDKTYGLILLVVGLLTRFNAIYNVLISYEYLAWPLAFLICGGWLIFKSLRKH